MLEGAIYDPPTPEFPYIVVLFDEKGDVRVVRAVDSRPAGIALLDQIRHRLAEFGYQAPRGKSRSDDLWVTRAALPRSS